MEQDCESPSLPMTAKHQQDKPADPSPLSAPSQSGQQVFGLQSRGSGDTDTRLVAVLLATAAVCTIALTIGDGLNGGGGAWQRVVAPRGPRGGSPQAPWSRRLIGYNLLPEPGSVVGQMRGREGQLAGAFVMLVGPNQTRGLELALQSLHLSILRYNPRPVLLFYGDDVPAAESAKEVIDGVAPPAIRDLIEVHHIAGFLHETLPPAMKKIVFHNIRYSEKYPGYHAMCHWFFVRILRHPRIRQLDYYFRIDTDTRFVRPHREDFFDIMAAGNYTYAWVLGGRERGTLTEGLWDYAADYMQTQFTKDQQEFGRANGFWDEKDGYAAGTDDKGNRNFMMIWNEMEVVDVRRFRQRDMMAFAEAVEETHHIYDRRWGDSPLRHIEVRLFLNRTTEVKCLRPPLFNHQDKKNEWVPSKELLEGL